MIDTLFTKVVVTLYVLSFLLVLVVEMRTLFSEKRWVYLSDFLNVLCLSLLPVVNLWLAVRIIFEACENVMIWERKK
jgi:hypothetical protein